MSLNSLHLFVRRREVVLITFIVFHVFMAINYISHDGASNRLTEHVVIRLLVLCAYCTIALLALKKQRIATKIMAIILILSGCWNLFLAFFGVQFSQYLLKAVGILMGVYFLYGGKMLFFYASEQSSQEAGTSVDG